MKKINKIILEFEDGTFKGYNYNAFMGWIRECVKIKQKKVLNEQNTNSRRQM